MLSVTVCLSASTLADDFDGALRRAPDAEINSVQSGEDGWLTSGSAAFGEIQVPFRSSPTEEFAALELREYIHRATGVSLPIRPEGRGACGTVLSVGRTKALEQADMATAMLFSTPEDFIVQRVDATIHLVGGEDRGTLYAVYSFLESEVGVRWYHPGDGGESVQRLLHLAVTELNRREAPALPVRGAILCASQRVTPSERHAFNVWATRNRLNLWDARCPDDDRFYQRRGGWAMACLTPEDGTIEGRVLDLSDVKERVDLATSNAAALAAKSLTLESQRYPFVDALFLTPSRGALPWCESAEAAKRDPTGLLTNADAGMGFGDRPDRVAAFAASVGALLAQSPNQLPLAWEGRLDRPPLVAKVPPGSLVIVESAASQGFAAGVKQWRDTGARVVARIRTIGVNGAAAASAEMLTHQVPSLSKSETAGVWLDVTTDYAFDAPLPFLAARLAWDSSFDVIQARDEYYKRLYGAAAPAASIAAPLIRMEATDDRLSTALDDALTSASRLARNDRERKAVDRLRKLRRPATTKGK